MRQSVLMRSKVRDLEKRVNQLSERKGPSGRAENPWDRVVARLTEDERMALCVIIVAAEKENHGDVEEKSWLATRSPDEQAVVRRVTALREELGGEAI